MGIRRSQTRALVATEQALGHALMAVRRAWAAGIADLQDFGAAEFDPEPLTLYDLNGEPLFHEFRCLAGTREVGRVKAAASRLVGSPVVSIERGPRSWDAARAVEMAVAAAKKAYPRQAVAAKELVCYSYPKIGVRVQIGGDKGASAIFDVADGSQVEQFGADAADGQCSWSFLDTIGVPALEDRLRRFDEHDKEMEAARASTPEMFAKAYTARELVAVRAKLILPSDYIKIPFYSSKVLSFGPRCSPHDCFELYAQQTNVYCAVATGQMILDFYRYPFEQTAIAAAMGTGATGTSFAGQETGYETLSNGCLDAGHDFSADWTEAKAEIDANRPLKSGIPGHARACAGWKRQNISLVGVPPKRWLQIYDPWPWNADLCSGGAVYWEDWDAVTHTNFCYVRHASSAHA